MITLPKEQALNTNIYDVAGARASFPEAVFYEPEVLRSPLGQQKKKKYGDKEWRPIASHNAIEEMQKKENKEFPRMKQALIVGVRKTHKYVENHKVSDYLVP